MAAPAGAAPSRLEAAALSPATVGKLGRGRGTRWARGTLSRPSASEPGVAPGPGAPRRPRRAGGPRRLERARNGSWGRKQGLAEAGRSRSPGNRPILVALLGREPRKGKENESSRRLARSAHVGKWPTQTILGDGTEFRYEALGSSFVHLTHQSLLSLLPPAKIHLSEPAYPSLGRVLSSPVSGQTCQTRVSGRSQAWRREPRRPLAGVEKGRSCRPRAARCPRSETSAPE